MTRSSIRSDVGPFSIIPEWVLDVEVHDRPVSDRAVRLFAVLGRYADRDGIAFPSRKTLADRLACSVDSVDRAVAELVELGALTVDKRRSAKGDWDHNEYRLFYSPAPGVAAGLRPGSRTDAAGGSRTDAAGTKAMKNDKPTSLREVGPDAVEETKKRTRQPSAAELIAMEALEDLIPRIQRGAGIDLGTEVVGRFRKAWSMADRKGVNPQSAGQAVLAAYYYAVTGEEATGKERQKIGRLVNSFQVLAVAGFEAAMKKDLEGDWLAYAWSVCKGLQRDHEVRQERGTG